MSNEVVIPFEHGEPFDEEYYSVDNETEKLQNLQKAMRVRSNKVREDYITELQGGLGVCLKKFVSNPQQYEMPVVHKTKWQKFKEFISKLTRIL